MNTKRYRKWAAAGISVCIAAQAAAFLTAPASAEVGAPVPAAVASTLRGGDAMPSCAWFKSTECKEVVRADLTTCPSQTYYYQEQGEGAEYAKNDGIDYCGTAREGSPDTYDCTTAMIDLAGCVK